MSVEVTAYFEPLSTQILSYYELTALNSGFKRDHYSLTSWNTKEDGTGTQYALDSILDLTSDIKLYAQWQKETKSITLTTDSNGTLSYKYDDKTGTVDSTSTISVSYRSTLELTANPHEGYSVLKWSDNNQCSESNREIQIVNDATYGVKFALLQTLIGQFQGSAYDETHGTFVVGDRKRGILWSDNGQYWHKSNLYEDDISDSEQEINIFDVGYHDGTLIATAGECREDASRELHTKTTYGIYKSTDGGKTWIKLELKYTEESQIKYSDNKPWFGVKYDDVEDPTLTTQNPRFIIGAYNCLYALNSDGNLEELFHNKFYENFAIITIGTYLYSKNSIKNKRYIIHVCQIISSTSVEYHTYSITATATSRSSLTSHGKIAHFYNGNWLYNNDSINVILYNTQHSTYGAYVLSKTNLTTPTQINGTNTGFKDGSTKLGTYDMYFINVKNNHRLICSTHSKYYPNPTTNKIHYSYDNNNDSYCTTLGNTTYENESGLAIETFKGIIANDCGKTIDNVTIVAAGYGSATTDSGKIYYSKDLGVTWSEAHLIG